MTHAPSKPFPMNTNITPIVVAAREALTAKHRASVDAAKGMSVELVNAVRYFNIQRGVVYFAGHIEFVDTPGIQGEKITLAHRMPDEYQPSEY